MAKLLIVDDNQQNLYMLHTLLTASGFEVLQASNGAQALEVARNTPPDMVISDILMPVMDGFSLCRAWKQDPLLRKIPFVFYTATYTDSRDEEFALNLGAERFIIKPQEPEKLVEILQGVFITFKAGKLVAPHEPLEEEAVFSKEYNQTLIRKLEDKMLQLKQANQRLTVLYQGAHGLTALRSSKELVLIALRATVETVGFHQANFFEYDENQGNLHLLDAIGFDEDILADFKEKLAFCLGEEHGLVGLVAQTRQPLIIKDTSREPRWVVIDGTIRSALFVPVMFEKRLWGVATITSREINNFDDEDARNIATLANSLAMALESAHLFERSQTTELYYRTILESSADAIISVDPDLKIKVWNIGAEQIFGYTREEIIGQPLNILTPLQEQQIREKMLTDVRKKGFVRNFQTQRLAKDGKLIDVEMTVTHLGSARGFTAVVRDITERKRAEAQLQEYSQNLEKMVAERTRELQDTQEKLLRQERLATMGQLAGSVGHELRNPLNVISASIYLLNKTLGGIDEKSQEYLDIISQETDKSAKIIKDLLDFGRESAANKERVNVSSIVAQALARNNPPENVAVTSSEIPGTLTIMADPQQIGQVLDNLISNACQAMPNGGKLTVKAAKQKGQVNISVVDTGTGISKENISRLFEPLFTTKVHGIGLGLALSKYYVEANGGSISVKSEENKGSTFTISLKAKES